MFFGTGGLKKFAMLEFLANKVTGLQAFRNLQNLLEHLFYRTLTVAAFGNILWTFSLFHNANDESCHCLVRIGSPALISFHCVCFVSFYFSLRESIQAHLSKLLQSYLGQLM